MLEIFSKIFKIKKNPKASFKEKSVFLNVSNFFFHPQNLLKFLRNKFQIKVNMQKMKTINRPEASEVAFVRVSCFNQEKFNFSQRNFCFLLISVLQLCGLHSCFNKNFGGT